MEDALRGESNTAVIDDYRGIAVLSSYTPPEIEGVDWVLLSEIDVAEAHAPIDALRRLWLLTGVIGGPLAWTLTVLLVMRSKGDRS